MEPQLLDYVLSSDVRAFSTTRMGGVGEGAYSEFNITHYCGDKEENVAQNRKLLCQTLGINDHQLFLPKQVHGTRVLRIDDDFLKLPQTEQQESMEGVDALITAIPRLCIGVSTADCVPVLLYDEVRKVSAAVHAGWRGTVSRIVSKVVDTMIADFGCNPENIKAVIGPSISLDAFEVGREVYEEFSRSGFVMSDLSRFYPASDGDCEHDGVKGKWHIDLWAANFMQMMESGIPMEQIQVANVCTYKTSDSFFSARKMDINSGRIFNGIMIKE